MKTHHIVLLVIGAFSLGCFVTGLWLWLEPLPWAVEYYCLMLGGAIGGAARALTTDGGQGKFRLPRWTKEADQVLDLGIIGEIGIGIVGAIISLLFVAVILGDGAIGGDKKAPLMWARMLAFGGLAGFAARQFLPNLAARFSKLIETEIEAQAARVRKELEKKGAAKVEQARTQTEIQDLARSLPGTPPPTRTVTTAAHGTPPTPIEQLKSLCQEYAAINIADYEQRVAARATKADEMANVVGTNDLTSTQLVTAIEAEALPAKEWMLPLATLIAARPKPGDAGRLFNIYEMLFRDANVRVDSKFLLYRVLIAISSLESSKRLPKGEKGRACKIANECRAIDDASLKRKADAVLDLLGC